jgi:hypothetical protein
MRHRQGNRGRAVRALAIAIALQVPAPALAATPPGFVGALHEHSGYSDGWPGSRPADYYASGRAHGLDFMGGSDHSDNLGLPDSTSQYCLSNSPPPATCAVADPVNPGDAFRKWDATLEQASGATKPSFTAFRGFEWTSDRFGHINVYFSTNWANAKDDGGYASMESFWSWLLRPASLGGGGDGLATFNHPGAKKLSTSDPAYNWDDFSYMPAADPQMVGIEVYNSASDYGMPGAHGSPAEGWYAHALDRGWHVGAVGAEDLGHERGDDWGGPGQAKTVVLSRDRSVEALEAAMRARRFYAVSGPGYRLSLTVAGAQMGSRLSPSPGTGVPVRARLTNTSGSLMRAARLELVTSGGRVVAEGAGGGIDARRSVSAAERWYFVRALLDGKPVAYSSPVWVEAG